jgi:predicted DCC family thiol-disulfide oxidoreductase YuxK
MPDNAENPSETRPQNLLLYDDDCRFCKMWIRRWKEIAGQAVSFEPYQQSGPKIPEYGPEDFSKAVFLREKDGRITRGAEAVARLYARPWEDPQEERRFGFLSRFKRGKLLRLYQRVKPARKILDTGYRAIARHRRLLYTLTVLFWGRDVRRSQYFLSRDFFLRLLGVVSFFAFWSLLRQVAGLIGPEGLLPAGTHYENLREAHGPAAFWREPSVFIFTGVNPPVEMACLLGMAGSLALAAGLAPPLCCALLWALYLSLAGAGQVFLGFQWDNLLLEMLLIGLLLSPARAVMTPRAAPPPNRLALWIAWILLFKLMWQSGIVKITSGDETWANATALFYHFETQPLPAFTAWHAHNAPEWVLQAACRGMFVLELLFPFFIFGPRRFKHLAFAGLVTLQLGIAATGNYGFFNILSLVLCVPLLDDRLFPAAVRRRLLGTDRRTGLEPRTVPPLPRALALPGEAGRLALAATFLLASGFWLSLNTRQYLAMKERRNGGSPQPIHVSAPMRAFLNAIGPFRSFNSYGLFANMTTERPEIVIQGSHDGVTWQTYRWKWKINDPAEVPAFTGPHMPRLDWQMWFAALGRFESDRVYPWFTSLLAGLLRNDPETLDLLGENPFPDLPPQYIRAGLFDYNLTTPEQRRATGQYWTRAFLEPYTPTVTLNEQGNMVRAR